VGRVVTSLATEAWDAGGEFNHEAFFYAGDDEFTAGAVRFLRQACTAGEPALVVVSARKIDLLRKRLKADAAQVIFADMVDVGLNPARIIPAWTDFVTEFEGQRIRGIGEPIWAERTPAELVECQRHESLLNVAFAGSTGFTLMCPYDVVALGHDVLDEARRSHPLVRHHGTQSASSDYLGTKAHAGPFSQALSEPPTSSVDVVFPMGSLAGVRSLVWSLAMNAGLGEARSEDAVTAVNEVASNSMCHAGGTGILRIWQSDDTLVCEVSDDGHIGEPLVGRLRPEVQISGGRGLWMVNQLCDLVQVRSFATGTTVRMHIRRPPA
jgi:anti-sigma regulatory factor (Ser/Thr protein kinase)